MQFNEHEAAFRRAANRLSRRDFLNRLGAGMGAIGLAGVLGEARGLGATAASPLFPKAPHFAPRAKRVIQLFMPGGPAQSSDALQLPKARKAAITITTVTPTGSPAAG